MDWLGNNLSLMSGYYFIVQAWNIGYNPCLWSTFINSA